jgi:hypothetical protein
MPTITSGRLALATSSLALVVAAGGAGYAAATITGADIKNNSVTGKDVKESSLKTVPSAKTASSATSATNAGAAGSVDGMSFAKVVYSSSASTPLVVFNGGGLTISASCPSGDLALTATTSKQNSSIYSHLVDVEADTVTGNDLESEAFDVTESFDLLAGVSTSATDPAVITFAYDAVDGTVATGTLSTDLSCTVTGSVTFG